MCWIRVNTYYHAFSLRTVQYHRVNVGFTIDVRNVDKKPAFLNLRAQPPPVDRPECAGREGNYLALPGPMNVEATVILVRARTINGRSLAKRQRRLHWVHVLLTFHRQRAG